MPHSLDLAPYVKPACIVFLIFALGFWLSWINSTAYENVVFDHKTTVSVPLCNTRGMCGRHSKGSRYAVFMGDEMVYTSRVISDQIVKNKQYRAVLRGRSTRMTNRWLLEEEPR